MDLIKLIKRNPAVLVGVAAFAGLALGAGWLPIGLPSMPAPAGKAKPASPMSSSGSGAGAPTPAPDPLDSY